MVQIRLRQSQGSVLCRAAHRAGRPAISWFLGACAVTTIACGDSAGKVVSVETAEAGVDGADDGMKADASTEEHSPPAEPDFLTGPVPFVLIDVGGKSIAKDIDTLGTIKVVEGFTGPVADVLAQPPTLASRVAVSVRGSSSTTFYRQKSFSLELRDDGGTKNRQLAVLGFPAESDWALVSCYSDKTCIRNVLTYAIGREIAESSSGRYWAPRIRWAEVYIDNDYRGLYQFVERVKKDRNRVSLPEPSAVEGSDASTGGYLFSAENAPKSPIPLHGWLDTVVVPSRYWRHRYPAMTNITPSQHDYIVRSFTDFETALTANPRWDQPTWDKVDQQSWVDFLLVQELTNNADGFFRSWYIEKAGNADGGRYAMGPIWDFDLAYGNMDYDVHLCPTTSPTITITSAPRIPEPFLSVFRDQAFQDALRCRWNTLRQMGGPLDMDRIEAKIAAYANHIKDAMVREAGRWNNIGRWVWPNNYVGKTWEDEVQFLRYWLRLRLQWLDANLTGACPAAPAPPPVQAIDAPLPGDEGVVRVGDAAWHMGKDSMCNLYIPLDGTVITSATFPICQKIVCPMP